MLTDLYSDSFNLIFPILTLPDIWVFLAILLVQLLSFSNTVGFCCDTLLKLSVLPYCPSSLLPPDQKSEHQDFAIFLILTFQSPWTTDLNTSLNVWFSVGNINALHIYLSFVVTFKPLQQYSLFGCCQNPKRQ